MKFQPDAAAGTSITGYGAGWIAVNGERFDSSIVICSSGERFAWNCDTFDALQAAHFAQLATLGAELILFGSGERIRFPQPQWLQALYAQRIGVETMDTQAACRTFNFLAAEGRKVVAAILL
ncbi:MAG: Mth938-like domain-containing protein [Burkholderiales bacterium]|jgi:uncharacterized protein|nr:Mth938-like domain-containing protein [Burkholderiales bacterium]MBK9346304.1 Mth938-like domain-containing protein [Burkholderiales bacterium]